MRALLFACGLLLALAAGAQPPAGDRRIAITLDDLPWAGETTPAQMAEGHARLMAQLKRADAPVTGFVNESRLEIDGKPAPARIAMLEDWLDAGFDLGNHTYAHQSLHDIGVPAFQQSILDGERELRPLMAKRGMAPRWFRHPYLRNGMTPADKQTIENFLAGHGYRVAPVTVDNSDWLWAQAYRRVLAGDAAMPEREAMLRRLREGYVPYMLNKLDYYERQSIDLLGYNPPQVWLLHANELNADVFAELVAATRRRGYRTITLDEAMRDPAYRRADGYRGQWGPSWIHRCAMAERRPKSFYAGEPLVPGWVMDLAGVDSE